MKWVIACVFLCGCAELPQQSELYAKVRQAEVVHVEAFNKLRNADMPIPPIELADLGKAYGDETNASNPIRIDIVHCEADLDDCLNDTIPHELAHWALSYYGYYSIHADITPQGRKLFLSEGIHDGIWCDTMRAFGGVPEKHGYCH